MRIIAVGCEYSGVSTLIDQIDQWGKSREIRHHLDDHFTILGLNIQEMFLTGMERYPVERTLLTTGAHDALMESRYRGHIVIETPHLNIGYSPSKSPVLNPF